MLDDIKAILGIRSEDHDKDAVLTSLLNDTDQRILAYINNGSDILGSPVYPDVPEGLAFVEKNITLASFRRMGDEGVTSTTDGDFEDEYVDAMAPYQDILNTYRDAAGGGRGTARFM